MKLPQESRLLFALSLGLAALIYACTLTYPFNNDNALYAYMADLLLHGRLPYLGSWDQNFPGILLVHVVPLLFGLRSQLVFHVWDILLQLLASALLFRVLARTFSVRAAALGVVLVALYYVHQGLWMSGERDTYATLLLLVAMVCEDKPGIAGLAIGSTVVLRPTYGLFVIVWFIWYLFSGHDVRLRITRAIQFGAAASVPTLLLAVIYFAAGGFSQLWQAVISFNFKIYSGHGEQFDLLLPIRAYLWSIPAIAIGGWLLWKRSPQQCWLWLGLIVASFASLIALYRHSVYHYHPMMVLLIALSAGGWWWIAERISTKQIIRAAICTLVLCFFTYQTFRGNTITTVLRAIASGERSLDRMYDQYEGSPAYGTSVQQRVGEYIAQHTSEAQFVQMFGPYSYPQYFAQRETASRFQTIHALLMRGSGDSLQPFQRAWREEYLRALALKQPAYFIVCDAPEAFRQYYGGLLGHEVLAKDFTQLGDWLHQRYTRDTAFGAFTLYRLQR